MTKNRVLAVALAVAMVAAMAGVFSTGVSAQQQTWSVAVYLEYADGTSYDIVIARGLTNAQKASMLADCGRSHRQGTVVKYHCYPIPE